MSICYIVWMMGQMHAPHLDKIIQQKNTSHTNNVDWLCLITTTFYEHNLTVF